MDTKKFQRNIEDFKCEHCGNEVKGSGYTNHCPNCLWSKHVDVNPGDRAEECGGMMKPVRVETDRANEFMLVHKCERCGYERRNRVEKEDSVEKMMEIAKNRKLE
ncbi:MAG: RNHCP domain-containing protein [bacterium]